MFSPRQAHPYSQPSTPSAPSCKAVNCEARPLRLGAPAVMYLMGYVTYIVCILMYLVVYSVYLTELQIQTVCALCVPRCAVCLAGTHRFYPVMLRCILCSPWAVTGRYPAVSSSLTGLPQPQSVQIVDAARS